VKTKREISKGPQSVFEKIKQVNEYGQDFWSSRKLSKILEYSEYRHFLPVVKKAKEACMNSGQPIDNHFEDVLDMVRIGSGAMRQVEDIKLSRYACYLIVQNADPAKNIVAKDIHIKKRLKKNQKILDHMGSTELAANLFRATQTEEKIRRENIQGKEDANLTHFKVGKKVRQTIKELGGTMPENLPTAESIKKLEKQRKKELK
jgi:DNA-damage-inducible protein D